MAHAIPLNYPESGFGNTELSQPGGAIAADRSPWSVSVFRLSADALFRFPFLIRQFFLFFHRKSVLNKGIKITLYPFLIFPGVRNL
jgi:hypothetical protein